MAMGWLFATHPVFAGSVGSLVSFTNGTVADADQVNANFQAIRSAVDDNDARLGLIEAGGGGGNGGSDAIRWVTFDGRSGTAINASQGVDRIERESAGEYTIYWSTPFTDANYVVTGTCNMWGSGGARFALEGHNHVGRQYEGVTASRVQIGCRDANAAQVDVDLIHVMAVKHSGGHVVFDGTENTPIIRSSSNVRSVTKNTGGEWRIEWATPFADDDYLVVGSCNAEGHSGAIFGLEGNNLVGDSFNDFRPEYVDVGCRDTGAGSGRNSDYISVTAIPSDGGSGPGTPDAFVSFNGEGGVTTNASSGVASVVRTGTGQYTVTWSTPFPDKDYVVTGTCNMEGTSGAQFGFEGNNLTGNTYEGFYENSIQIGCRDAANGYRDSDLIHVLAFESP
jgi:hypothetical protein